MKICNKKWIKFISEIFKNILELVVSKNTLDSIFNVYKYKSVWKNVIHSKMILLEILYMENLIHLHSRKMLTLFYFQNYIWLVLSFFSNENVVSFIDFRIRKLSTWERLLMRKPNIVYQDELNFSKKYWIYEIFIKSIVRKIVFQ